MAASDKGQGISDRCCNTLKTHNSEGLQANEITASTQHPSPGKEEEGEHEPSYQGDDAHGCSSSSAMHAD